MSGSRAGADYGLLRGRIRLGLRRAAEYEFKCALNKRDFAWLKLQLAHAKGWLDDPYLPKELTERCRLLMKEYSKHVVVE